MSIATYTVVAGDTLTKIARQFGTTVNALAKANNIPNQDLIYAGQVLLIPDAAAVTKNANIRTTVDRVALRSSAEFKDDNVLQYLPRYSTFQNAELHGDWWTVSGGNGFVHTSGVEIIRDRNIAQGEIDAIPYRSQWDVDANNRNDDCGQTCVAMLAEWRGVNVRVNDLPFQSVPAGDTTATDLVRNLGSDAVKLPAHIVPVAMGDNPPLASICLIWYGGLRRSSVQDVGYVGWHWVVLIDEQANHVIVHDPDFWGDRRDEGSCKQYSREEWDMAFIPYGGVSGRTCVVLD